MAQQRQALDSMKLEADAFEKGAKGYRDAITSIIKLHYETKKREVLSGLDKEIVAQISALKGEPAWMTEYRLKAGETLVVLGAAAVVGTPVS